MAICFVPAFTNGLSVLPAPAIIPMVALHEELRVLNLPDGSLTTVLSLS